MIRKLRQIPRRRKLLLTILTLCGVVFVAIYFWLFHGLPPISALEDGLALPSTRIFDRSGKLLYEILPPEQGRNTVVALEDIPQHCRNAVIATEDANFYAHPGVDVVGVMRALWINLQGGEVLAGGSTITQQVARTLLFDPQQRAERTLQRKLKEMILALRLQAEYSKDEVLALYLNQVYFGNLAYGIEGAARAYFGKGAGDLSLAECALLAGVIQNAALYDPLSNLSNAEDRQAVVLDLMAQNGFLTTAEAEIAKNDELQFAAVPFPIEAPHFVMAVWKQLERDYPLYREGLDVVTTVNLDWQKTAQTVVQQQLNYLNNPTNNQRVSANANNAALVAIDPFTGQILTMLGSPDYFDERIDGAVNATLALRQPGSTLKPFTYAAAMNPLRAKPWTAATLVLDVRTAFVTRKLESYIPSNYGFKEHGPVLAREALASSYNIPAVVALEDVGIEKMIELAANAGLETLIDNTEVDLSVTLGGGEVRLLDLTQAYSIFPNGGYRIEPAFILSVQNRKTGEYLYQWQPPLPTTRVIDERVAFIISDILSDSSARSGEFGRVSALDLARPAAAKTGTTTDFRDNWTVGYTPTLVVGVWVGNADNLPMVDVTGVSGAAPIWNEFMRRVLTGQPEIEFDVPEGLHRIEICALSGLLPTPACTLRREEWFIPGTEPTQPDTFYQVVEMDRMTGLPADAATPASRRVRQTFIVLPEEAREWGQRNGIPSLPAGEGVAQTTSGDAARLRILSPAPFITYQLSPLTPGESQRIRFSVGVPPGTRAVRYLLNGTEVANVDTAPYETWWTLQIGEYELTAVSMLNDGTEQTSEPVRFSVVEYEAPGSRNAP
jgi:penicillin-binding protein 1C